MITVNEFQTKLQPSGLYKLVKVGVKNPDSKYVNVGQGYVTTDQVEPHEEEGGILEDVFHNGKILRTQTLDEIRKLAYS